MSDSGQQPALAATTTTTHPSSSSLLELEKMVEKLKKTVTIAEAANDSLIRRIAALEAGQQQK